MRTKDLFTFGAFRSTRSCQRPSLAIATEGNVAKRQEFPFLATGFPHGLGSCFEHYCATKNELCPSGATLYAGDGTGR